MIGLLDTPAASIATRRVAILGCGNVGAEVARQLQTLTSLRICSVLVRDVQRQRPVGHEVLTDSFEAVLASRPDVIIELLGGIEPARSHIEAALRRGIHVVTANKSIIARHGESLHRIARQHGAALRYEAAVGAGVPLLAALDQLRGDRITAIRGVVNGTCNFILDRLDKRRCTLDEALAEAQRLGFAEPDPSADITGRDSAEKLCVLAHEARWGWINPGEVPTVGIETITAEDVQCARRRHCVIRLVAEAQRDEHGAVSLRVGPTFVPRSHPLASASGCENAFEIEAINAGTIHLRGPGAGARPTASAVISDLLAVAEWRGAAPAIESPPREVRPATPRRHYIRASTGASVHEPGAVLAALDRHRVEADSIELCLSRTIIHTLPVEFDDATELAHTLANGDGSQCLVAPFVEG